MEKKIPCGDCAAEKYRLEHIRRFKVLGCDPIPGDPGWCLIRYIDPVLGEAHAAAAPAAAAAPLAAAVPAAAGDDASVLFAGRALPLSPPAVQQVLGELDVPAEALWAVLRVETAGCGFLPDRRPQILFERHKFSQRTGGAFDAQAPAISNPVAGGYAGGAGEYYRLERAMALDHQAALESASWGLGQVMGFNAQSAGYADVEELVRDSAAGEDGQLRAMARFIASNNLAKPLREGNWKAVARSYNGPKYAEKKYDEQLAKWQAHYAARGVPDVGLRAAQLGLLLLGYLPVGGVDGVFGGITGDALRRFRRDQGLPGAAQPPDDAALHAIGQRLGW
jgi:hypothetical protein